MGFSQKVPRVFLGTISHSDQGYPQRIRTNLGDMDGSLLKVSQGCPSLMKAQ